MRTLLLFAIVITMSTIALTQTLPAPQAVTDPKQISSKSKTQVEKNLSIEKLYMTRAIGATAWSPDGKTIAFISNISGRNNLWLVPAEGGWPTQLTVSDQRQTAPAWSPDGKWIAYMSDYDGDEQWDIFLVSPSTGQVVNLTNTREIAEESPTWSPDGRYLAYMVKPKTSSVFEIDVYDTLMRETRHLTTGTAKNKMNVSPIWSRDGKWIVYTQQQAKGTDSNIFVAEVASGKSTLLTPHQGEQLYSANDFSPDGKQVLITANAANGYDNVALLDIASKKISWLTQDKWEISGGNFSSDSKSITWTANVDGNTDIYLHDIASGKTASLPLPKGVNQVGGAESAFTRDGSRLLYYHNGPNAPNDVWIYSLADGKSRQITHALVAGVRAQGYIVIAPNYRGSTGYGKEFQQANLFDMGGGDLQDVLAAADWIKQTGYVDPKKLILMGGSYGGYMTMMGVTKAPDVWAGGVPIVPFVNWFTEIENEDPVLQQSDLATMGDPVKNKALFEDRSPINFIDRVKAPLLLLAGGHDPRCPKTEAQQVVDAIKKRGGVVEYKVYENEGHGFARVENQIDAYKRVAEFLKAHVPPADCGCSLNE